MSYHVTILRSSAGTQLPITLQEAQTAAESVGGWTFRDSPPTFCLDVEGHSLSLWYRDGELWTKNPDSWAVGNMIQLANSLGARVRGGEFETYRSADDSYNHPDDRVLKKKAEIASQESVEAFSRLEKRVRYGIYGFFIILAVVASLVARSCERQ